MQFVGWYVRWSLTNFGFAFKSKLCLQVNNYEIVINFFHISYNLTWYWEIVQNFRILFNLWTDKTINGNLCKKSISKRITCTATISWIIEVLTNYFYYLTNYPIEFIRLWWKKSQQTNKTVLNWLRKSEIWNSEFRVRESLRVTAQFCNFPIYRELFLLRPCKVEIV